MNDQHNYTWGTWFTECSGPTARLSPALALIGIPLGTRVFLVYGKVLSWMLLARSPLARQQPSERTLLIKWFNSRNSAAHKLGQRRPLVTRGGNPPNLA